MTEFLYEINNYIYLEHLTKIDLCDFIERESWTNYS